MKASKIAYKPVGLALRAVSGIDAGSLFRQVWKMLGHDENAPDATDEERSWREVLLAATLQGASSPVSKPPSTAPAPPPPAA